MKDRRYQISVYVDQKQLTKIDKVNQETGKSISDIVRKLIYAGMAIDEMFKDNPVYTGKKD